MLLCRTRVQIDVRGSISRAQGAARKARIAVYVRRGESLVACVASLMRANCGQTSATGEPLLLQFTQQCITAYAERVGIDRSESSLRKYRITCKHLQGYITQCRQTADVPLKQSMPSSLTDLLVTSYTPWRSAPKPRGFTCRHSATSAVWPCARGCSPRACGRVRSCRV